MTSQSTKQTNTAIKAGKRLLSAARISGFMLMVLLSVSLAFGQTGNEYDETSVFLQVHGLGGVEVPAVIRGQKVYLPVYEVFSNLKINAVISSGLDSVSGFFPEPGKPYLVDYCGDIIIVGDESYALTSGELIRTETNIYLDAARYGPVFGLDCLFNFRSLSVVLTARFELPLIREMRLGQMRSNINRLKGEIIADTNIGRTYPAFHLGMADWSVISTQYVNKDEDVRATLALGSVIAGGETNIILNYDSREIFSEKQQHYLWRYVNNDFRALRQIMAGKIPVRPVASVYAPVVGIQLTNTPTGFRKSFGSYTLSDYTEPDWTVELYVNNVLVDYKKADASGFFTFEVPLVYGNSNVKLRFYGPWGEERTREQIIQIPFNFLPAGKAEYNMAAGIVEDSLGSRFTQARISYGVTRYLTMGAGVEYLSAVSANPFMPFLTASLRLAPGVLINGDYTHGVKTGAMLTWRMPSNLQFDILLTRYKKGQQAINLNYLEERKIMISLPIHARKFSAYTRLTWNEFILTTFRYNTAEWLITGAVSGFSANLTTHALLIDPEKPYIYSNLSASIRLPAGFMFLPQWQYEYSGNKFISMKYGMEKHVLKHGFVNLYFERNFKSNQNNVELGFRYDFSFAQMGSSARRSGHETTLVEYVRGSLMADPANRYLGTNNRTSVGRGGLVIAPYLDINGNNHRDSGEQAVSGLTVRISGGRLKNIDADTTIRIYDLEAYSDYHLEFTPGNFDNIAWQLKLKSAKVTIDPNLFKQLEVPVAVMSEVSGRVEQSKVSGKKGLGRIIVNIYRSDSTFYSRTLTEDDGYFSYMGLTPGEYFVNTDTAQLRRLKMTSDLMDIPVIIMAGRDGEMVEDIDFVLTSLIPDQAVQDTQPGNVTAYKTESIAIDGENKFFYTIQTGAFYQQERAESQGQQLTEFTGRTVIVVRQRRFYKVRITGFTNRREAKRFLPELNKLGFIDAFIVKSQVK